MSCTDKFIISAKTREDADKIAQRLGITKACYIFAPTEDKKEREQRLAGLYGFRQTRLIGEFTYLEEERVTRKVG